MALHLQVNSVPMTIFQIRIVNAGIGINRLRFGQITELHMTTG